MLISRRSGLEHISWYAYKGEIRKYLREVNSEKKVRSDKRSDTLENLTRDFVPQVLEYTLFQPGLFANYFTYPYSSTNHIHQMELPFDFNNRRAIMMEGSDDDTLTLTTVQDVANVVVKSIDFQGEWSVIGGIRGTTISVKQLIALGEKLRGKIQMLSLRR